jgi:hypothetical protein
MNSMDVEKTVGSYKDWLKYMNENIEDDEDNSVEKMTKDLMLKMKIWIEKKIIYI